jgi:hypothetical protein
MVHALRAYSRNIILAKAYIAYGRTYSGDLIMEWYILGVLGLLCALCALVGGIVGGWASGMVYAMYWSEALASLRAEVQSAKNTVLSVKGVDARAEKSARMDSMMAEALAMFNEKKDVTEIIKTLGLKYPDLALSLLKKQKLI